MARRTPDEKAKQSAAVLTEIHEGLSLRKACEKAGIAPATFIDWVASDDVLAEQYAHAREAMIEKIAEETLSISDEPVPLTVQGNLDSAAVAKQRLQVDTRKWLLSKLAPKKYGDRIQNVVTGVDDGPVQVADMTDEQRRSRIAELEAKLRGAK